MNSSDSDLASNVPGAEESQPIAEPAPLPPALPADAEQKIGAPESKEPSRKDKEKEKDREKDKDKGRKKKKKNKEEFRRADPWQRYKALLDALKEAQDLVDLADHKARFALIIMGALNAAILILGTRSDIISRLSEGAKLWLYLYFVLYAVIAVYFFVQAIESLRPRSELNKSQNPGALPSPASIPEKERSLGLRFFAEAVKYELPAYVDAWQGVRVSQLNAELATQIHTIAKINRAKYAAIAKLYSGLQAITLLTWGLLVAIAVFAWVEHAAVSLSDRSEKVAKSAKENSGEPPKIKSGKPKKGGWAILGQPERLAPPDVKEASGIAFSPARGTFFVVGDEGSLVELSATAKLIAKLPLGGNLEDVALHTPSGRLVLLSEKKGELIVFDPATGKKTGRFKIDDEALLGEKGVDKNQGFEGLAFRPEAKRPGGGVFYLVHQREPALLVTIAFDPLAPSATLGAESVLARTPIANRDDLTAVTYDASLDRLFVIADSKDRIVMLDRKGEEEAEIVLPGVQQEGLTFDAAGNLWIADDQAGLLVFRGAREKIAQEMKAPHPDPSPNESPQ